MSDITEITPEELAAALAEVGQSQEARDQLFEALRQAQLASPHPTDFRDRVRFPLIAGLLAESRVHRVTLANGVAFEVSLDSRIERALLLSTSQSPDHVWEPQTSKLLVALGRSAANVIIGGAYIGDHALLIARAMASDGNAGRVHSFEPMESSYRKLVRNIALNALADSVVPQRMALWSSSNRRVATDGDPALASSRLLADDESTEDGIVTISIDDYMADQSLASVELVMLDTEGGEEEALRGASRLLKGGGRIDVIFEVHRSFVDWSDGLLSTPIVRLLTDRGFEVFAVRDYHDNLSMIGQPVELIPADSVYLEGPPHGFNMLATGDFDRVRKAIDVRIVSGVSPKLLIGRDPKLHQPLGSAQVPSRS